MSAITRNYILYGLVTCLYLTGSYAGSCLATITNVLTPIQAVKKLDTSLDGIGADLNPKVIHQTLETPLFNPSALINSLAKDDTLKELFESSAGKSGGYSIRSHVLRLFEIMTTQLPAIDYFIHIKASPKVDLLKTMRITAALHDIGKPISASFTGEDTQDLFNLPLLKELMRKLKFTKEETTLSHSLVGAGVFGNLIQGKITVNEAYLRLSELAELNNLAIADYYQLQLFFFTIDAAAYDSLKETIFVESNRILYLNSPLVRTLEENIDF